MQNTTQELIDRAAGCAVGAALGDAFGMPLEFGPKVPPDHLVTDLQSGRLPAGSFTDDTEMALGLALSYLQQQPLDPRLTAGEFVKWLDTHPPDVGIQTREVLNRVAAGTPWQTASRWLEQTRPDAAGNGSVMRCWPSALANWNDPPQLTAESILQSRITHPHPDCTAASVFINHWIRAGLIGMDLHAGFKEALNRSSLKPDFRALIEKAPRQKRAALVNSGWVRHSLESVVWGIFQYDTFAEVIIQVANLGNDADTAASIAGAVAGAFYGLDQIPAGWRARLRGEYLPGSAVYWDAEKLASLAQDLVNLKN